MKNQATNSFISKIDKRFLLLVVVFLMILLRLGFWQLDRAQQKIDMQVQVDHQMAAAPSSICNYASAAVEPALQYVPVKIDARLTEQYFLIDNQTYEGKVGYEVIQIVQACNVNIAMSRGFVKASPDRSVLPALELNTGAILKAEGYLYLPQRNPYIAQHAVNIENFKAANQWPLRIQEVDMGLIAAVIDGSETLFPALVRLNEGQPSMFTAHWKLLTMTPAKHYGYAFQWFTLAALLLILFLYASFKEEA